MSNKNSASVALFDEYGTFEISEPTLLNIISGGLLDITVDPKNGNLSCNNTRCDNVYCTSVAVYEGPDLLCIEGLDHTNLVCVGTSANLVCI